MSASAIQSWLAFDFGALPSFSRSQVLAWNALRRAFAGSVGWETWVAEGLAEFFESPAGFEIRLRQRHTIDSQHAEAVFTSDSGELTLGRDETCDIRLAPRSVGNHHARIFRRGGLCYIEDLDSALGTFLNETRLAAHQPVPIASGDQFAIFPYTFAIELAERWVRDASIDVYPGPVFSFNGRAVRTSIDQALLAVRVDPIGAVLLLEGRRAFLEQLSYRLLAPFGAGTPARLGLTPVDTGFFELLAAAVLERVNRDLPFPLQVAVDPAAEECSSQAGLTFSFAIRIAELTGTFRLFITEDAMASLARLSPAETRPRLPDVSWTFPISAGFAELTMADVFNIEPADVVLLTREMALLFPNAPERGWRLLQDQRNVSQAAIDNFFERTFLNESEQEATNSGTTPDMAGLPIRMHAIVGEKEMTLAEANLLVAGVIVELDQMRSDPVRITLNGRITGAGELVEVDGRLGVRILNWRVP